MKNALILHGIGNNSQGNWFPWLKEQGHFNLEKGPEYRKFPFLLGLLEEK